MAVSLLSNLVVPADFQSLIGDSVSSTISRSALITYRSPEAT